MKIRHRHTLSEAFAYSCVVASFLFVFLVDCGRAQTVLDASEIGENTVVPVRTDDPRQTFLSFQRLSSDMEAALGEYLANPTFQGVSQLALLSDRMNSLIDLSAEAPAARREIGIQTATYLMDIFGRLPAIDANAIPDAAEIEGQGMAAVRLSGTPIYITQVSHGYRQGEFLFAASTVEVAPRFFRSIEQLPLRTSLAIDSLSRLGPQITGPLVPRGLVEAMPASLRALWLDTPAWKVVASIAAALLLIAVVYLASKLIKRLPVESRVASNLLRGILPVIVVIFASVVLPAFAFQINVAGRFADLFTTFKTVVTYVSVAWLYWVAIKVLFELVILSPKIPDTSLDANLLRLVSNVLGVIGIVVVVALGGQAIGVPILSVLAGLGIGGLAVALALRPTLENLLGGVILYMDRPVRLGDFCKFGEQTGTIEAIGVRSTKLRALDRTLISVPNAQFADMQITNFAHCDRMLLHKVIGIRYETSPDQLRFLLANIRSMMHAHPRVERETVRVRFAGYGDSALEIDLRVYIETREWNDYFAIREDIFLRLFDLINEAGTQFAFPSQTLYFRKDGGLDSELAEAAEATVAGWRKRKKLPFPSFAGDDIDKIEGTLDYPPRGSVLDQRQLAEMVEERLSANEDEEQDTETERPLNSPLKKE